MKYLDSSIGKFAIFSKILKNFIEFLAKIWTKIEKILKYAFVGGSGAEPPDASEFMEIWVKKQWKIYNF